MGVTKTWGTVLKDYRIRKVESHCFNEWKTAECWVDRETGLIYYPSLLGVSTRSWPGATYAPNHRASLHHFSISCSSNDSPTSIHHQVLLQNGARVLGHPLPPVPIEDPKRLPQTSPRGSEAVLFVPMDTSQAFGSTNQVPPPRRPSFLWPWFYFFPLITLWDDYSAKLSIQHLPRPQPGPVHCLLPLSLSQW